MKPKPPVPLWRWVLWMATLALALVVFYGLFTPVWFTLRLDRRTFLPRSLTMTAAAHFMTHLYTSFNEAPKIRAPSP